MHMAKTSPLAGTFGYRVESLVKPKAADPGEHFGPAGCRRYRRPSDSRGSGTPEHDRHLRAFACA